MASWSRSKSQDRVRKLSRCNDVSIALKELDRSRQDVALLAERPRSAIDGDHLRRREHERHQAEQAAHRLGVTSDIGISLPAFALKPASPPRVTVVEAAPPPPPPPPHHSHARSQSFEVAALMAELDRVNTRNAKLEATVRAQKQLRVQERTAWGQERQHLAAHIAKLKEEVEAGWTRVMRLRRTYEADTQQPSRRRSSFSVNTASKGGRMYLSDDDYESSSFLPASHATPRRPASSLGHHRRPSRPPIVRASCSSTTSGEDTSDYRPSSSMTPDDVSPRPPYAPIFSRPASAKGVRWSDRYLHSPSMSSSGDEDIFGSGGGGRRRPPSISELPDPYRERSRTRTPAAGGGRLPVRPPTIRMSSYA